MNQERTKKRRRRVKPIPTEFGKTLDGLLKFSKVDLDAAVKRGLEQKAQK